MTTTKPTNGTPSGGVSKDNGGVGNAAHPENLRVPESVLIKRKKPEDDQISETGPEVKGDKAMMIIDVLNSQPVQVIMVKGIALTPDEDARLIFVNSKPIMDVMTVADAKKKFAVKKDGTVIYGQRGFDDAAHLDFDMVDIVKLIEHNHSSAGVAEDKRIKDRSMAASDKQLAADKKVADDKKAADEKAAKDK